MTNLYKAGLETEEEEKDKGTSVPRLSQKDVATMFTPWKKAGISLPDLLADLGVCPSSRLSPLSKHLLSSKVTQTKDSSFLSRNFREAEDVVVEKDEEQEEEEEELWRSLSQEVNDILHLQENGSSNKLLEADSAFEGLLLNWAFLLSQAQDLAENVSTELRRTKSQRRILEATLDSPHLSTDFAAAFLSAAVKTVNTDEGGQTDVSSLLGSISSLLDGEVVMASSAEQRGEGDGISERGIKDKDKQDRGETTKNKQRIGEVPPPLRTSIPQSTAIEDDLLKGLYVVLQTPETLRSYCTDNPPSNAASYSEYRDRLRGFPRVYKQTGEYDLKSKEFWPHLVQDWKDISRDCVFLNGSVVSATNRTNETGGDREAASLYTELVRLLCELIVNRLCPEATAADNKQWQPDCARTPVEIRKVSDSMIFRSEIDDTECRADGGTEKCGQTSNNSGRNVELSVELRKDALTCAMLLVHLISRTLSGGTAIEAVLSLLSHQHFGLCSPSSANALPLQMALIHTKKASLTETTIHASSLSRSSSQAGGGGGGKGDTENPRLVVLLHAHTQYNLFHPPLLTSGEVEAPADQLMDIDCSEAAPTEEDQQEERLAAGGIRSESPLLSLTAPEAFLDKRKGNKPPPAQLSTIVDADFVGCLDITQLWNATILSNEGEKEEEQAEASQEEGATEKLLSRLRRQVLYEASVKTKAKEIAQTLGLVCCVPLEEEEGKKEEGRRGHQIRRSRTEDDRREVMLKDECDRHHPCTATRPAALLPYVLRLTITPPVEFSSHPP